MSVAWYPVMKARDLGKRPARVMLEGEALVIWRGTEGLGALADRCPHRSAPLSEGRVQGGGVACPYHGWEFDPAGHLTKLPAHEGDVPRCRVPRWDVAESDGLIFVCRDAAKAAPIVRPVWDDQPKVQAILTSEGVVEMADAAENMMDPVHTMFVHPGLIRSGNNARETLTMTAGLQDGKLVMRYESDRAQTGILSTWLEGPRSHCISTYEAPGIVSLQYWGPERLNMTMTVYLTPRGEGRLTAFALMTGPYQRGLGWLKAGLFVPVMRKVIAQDQQIMAQAHRNWEAAGRPAHLMGPLDILRPLIDAVVAGQGGDIPDRTIRIAL